MTRTAGDCAWPGDRTIRPRPIGSCCCMGNDREDAGEELAEAIVEFLADGRATGYGQVTAMSNGMSTGAPGWLGSMPMPVPVIV